MNLTKEEIAQIIYSAVSQAGHNKPSPETQENIQSIKDSLADLKADMQEIKDNVQPLISEAEFWNQFWGRVRKGGNVLTWTVGVIAAFLILTGQAKTILLAWLASRTF